MGGKATKRSRHQMVNDQNEVIGKLLTAWGGHIKTKDPNQQLLTHEEIDASLGKLATSIAEVYEEITEDLHVVQEQVLFNAQPFWKRWYQKWRDDRERLKNANRPALEPLITEEIKNGEEERIFGQLAEKARAAQRTTDKGEGEHNEPN